VARDKAYHTAEDAEEEEDRVAEAAALAMAWGLLGKEQEEEEEEEDHWQVRMIHRRSATRYHTRRDKESSPARQARAAAMAVVLCDEAWLATEATTAEADRWAHWAAELNAALAHRQDERQKPRHRD
jgi:hypothetical protein